MACGDEAGSVKVWDLQRFQSPVQAWQPHTDYVASLTWYSARRAILSVSGDGTLAVMDPRAKKVKHHSDEEGVDDELLSVAVLKGGKKVVCGTTTGVLNVWSWGSWNDCSDRFPGHPESVEAMVKLDEDTIATGSSDGMIRVVAIQPNKLLGVLGEHADYPIERLALSFDGQMLASASHDQTVRLWDLGAGGDEDEEGEDEDEVQAGSTSDDEDEKSDAGEAETGSTSDDEDAIPSNSDDQASSGSDADNAVSGSDGKDSNPVSDDDGAAAPSSMQAVAAGSDSDNQDSDDSDASDDDRRRKRRGRGKGAHRIPTKTAHKRSANASFFADLL